MEPWGERGQGFVGPVVWLGVDVGNPGKVTWAATLSKSCHPSIIQLFKVFGRLKEALSDGDGKAWGLSLIFLVSLQCFSVVGRGGVVNLLLEIDNLLFKVLDLDFVDEFAVLGGFNKASGDASEHGGIEIGVCYKGGGDSVGDRGITGGEGTQLGATEGWLAGDSLETSIDMLDMGL